MFGHIFELCQRQGFRNIWFRMSQEIVIVRARIKARDMNKVIFRVRVGARVTYVMSISSFLELCGRTFRYQESIII